MFDYLEGTVARRNPASVTLDVQGVGYALLVPLGTQVEAVGARMRAWIHLAVREDAHTLYGFGDEETRDVFRTLLSVKGVGPSMALAVLSGMNRAELLEAIAQEDLRRLTAIKGVGKKTAEQILLDLRDKIRTLAAGLEVEPGVITPAAPKSEGGENIEDAVRALTSLGFAEKDARKRVDNAAKSVDPKDLGQLVQAAFRGNT